MIKDNVYVEYPLRFQQLENSIYMHLDLFRNDVDIIDFEGFFIPQQILKDITRVLLRFEYSRLFRILPANLTGISYDRVSRNVKLSFNDREEVIDLIECDWAIRILSVNFLALMADFDFNACIYPLLQTDHVTAIRNLRALVDKVFLLCHVYWINDPRMRSAWLGRTYDYEKTKSLKELRKEYIPYSLREVRSRVVDTLFSKHTNEQRLKLKNDVEKLYSELSQYTHESIIAVRVATQASEDVRIWRNYFFRTIRLVGMLLAYWHNKLHEIKISPPPDNTNPEESLTQSMLGLMFWASFADSLRKEQIAKSDNIMQEMFSELTPADLDPHEMANNLASSDYMSDEQAKRFEADLEKYLASKKQV